MVARYFKRYKNLNLKTAIDCCFWGKGDDVTIPPQKMRELVFELMFSCDFQTQEIDELIQFISIETKTSKNNVRKAYDKVITIQNDLPAIDAMITKSSSSFRFERIGKAELAILRLAIYELCFEKSVPKEICISEAKRLAVKFSSPEAASFVHGVLDSILKGN